MLKFPENFLWGAATAAYQVEGGIDNCDWSEDFPAGKACDHYHKFKQDFDLLEELNLDAYRFSIEWSRIEPEAGEFDQEEIEHYKEFIGNLRKRNIEPFVTLWHFTNPLWFTEKGGWLSEESVKRFSSYVRRIVRELDKVNFWFTINEPLIYASHSYFLGKWPPHKGNLFSYFKAIHNLARAHKESYKAIKKISSENKVGIAKNNYYFEPYNNRLINRILKKGADWHWNYSFLNHIDGYQDFIGLNYYSHSRINYGFNKNRNKITSDVGWEIYPEGIYHVLKGLEKYDKPVFIAENGLADSEDELRKDFIKNHLCWTYKAIKDGVDVQGYFHWSLMDNFNWPLEKGSKWIYGYEPRFGLVEIDYDTLERKIRPSAHYYAQIAQTNSLK